MAVSGHPLGAIWAARLFALNKKPSDAVQGSGGATVVRTGEVIGATRSEIDAATKVWTIPRGRMKAKKEHRVPLSPRAFAIVRDITAFTIADANNVADSDAAGNASAFIFPGGKKGRSLSNMAMTAVLRRMGFGDTITVHGFRSTFRDWAAECTNFPNEVVEMALADAVGDKVEAAYRRGDLFDKRRLLMQQWATYCTSVPQKKAVQGTVMRPSR